VNGKHFVFAFMLLLGALFPLTSVQWSRANPSSVKEAVGPESEVQKSIENAEQALKANRPKEAIAIFQQTLSTYPDTSVRGKIYQRLGESYLRNRDPASAAVVFEKFLHEFPGSPDQPIVLDQLAASYLAQENIEGAISALERKRGLFQDTSLKKKVTERLVTILIENGRHVEAIGNLLSAETWLTEEREGSEEERKRLKDRIAEIIRQSRSEELAELIERYPRSYPGDMALLQLATVEESQGLLFEAERELSRFIRTFPDYPDLRQVESRLGGIKKELLQNRFLIGVLLPLSGSFQVFSEQVLRGIRLAIDRFEPTTLLGRAEKFVGLVVRDTEGNRARLVPAMRELISEYHVIAMIGPLLSSELEPVAIETRKIHIPVISPSATSSLRRDGGGYLFLNGMTLDAQGRFMAEHAMTKLGLTRFCILYPDDVYGRKLMRTFSETVIAQGGEIIGVEAYPPGANDFGPQIKRLKTVDLSHYGVLEPVEDNELRSEEYIPGFDAIYLPGDYDRVGLLAAELAFYDIKNVVLLGSNGWHSEDLLRIGGRYVEGGLFVDGFFPGSHQPAVQEFVSAYRSRYGEEPTLLVAQAYDSTMMVLRALEQSADTGNKVREYLGGLKDFPGVTGSITTKPDGKMERPLFVIQILKGQFVQAN
jgi:branched-chain amino acid transport system substrate-binding protein